MDEQRKGNWIETYSGVRFYPLDPRPEEVRLEDIAHALSHVCRYAGHCKEFYSVGQHCLAIQWEMKKQGLPLRLQLLGLLHDASEAYLCDIPKPIKPFFLGYKSWEDKISKIIWKAFNIEPPQWHEEKAIKRLDKIMLAIEAKRFMTHFFLFMV